MNDTDLRLFKLVRQADEERQRRIKAEQQLNAAKAYNAQLRHRLQAISTRDQAPPLPPVDRSR